MPVQAVAVVSAPAPAVALAFTFNDIGEQNVPPDDNVVLDDDDGDDNGNVIVAEDILGALIRFLFFSILFYYSRWLFNGLTNIKDINTSLSLLIGLLKSWRFFFSSLFCIEGFSLYSRQSYTYSN